MATKKNSTGNDTIIVKGNGIVWYNGLPYEIKNGKANKLNGVPSKSDEEIVYKLYVEKINKF